MQVYAITSQKGGVGKTTTTVNLGAALAQEGKRVLLLDLDPQGSLTISLGQTASCASMEDVLFDAHAIEFAIQTCRQDLHLVPATPRLAVALLRLAQSEAPTQRLTQALRRVWDRYDYALIDCPPSLSHATINALTAAHRVLVPLQCEFLALRGLMDIQEIVEVIRETTNVDLRLGIVGTMLDRRTLHGRDVLAEVRAALPGLVCETTIPRTIRLAEAPGTGQTIFEYAPKSSGAEAYRRLAQEILQEENRHEQTRRYSGRHAELALLSSS